MSEAQNDFPVSQLCGQLLARKVSVGARGTPAVYIGRSIPSEESNGRKDEDRGNAVTRTHCTADVSPAGVVFEGTANFEQPLHRTQCSESVAKEGHRTGRGLWKTHTEAGRTSWPGLSGGTATE